MDGIMGGKGSWNSAPLRVAAWSVAAALMAVALAAQLVTGGFGWSGFDFILVAVILAAGAALFDFIARRSPNFAYLAGAAAALAAGFGLFVVNGAVGLVGSEDEPINLLFGAVILVAIIGALRARGRRDRLAQAMVAAAITHVGVSIVAMLAVTDRAGAGIGAEIAGLSMFAGLWLASAALFRMSRRASGE
jgi:hypothetical protein